MKRLLAMFAVSLLPCLLAAQTDTITILHLNDTHSTLAPTGRRGPGLTASTGGIARAATVVGMTKMTEPNVLLLHAGDYSIGDLFYNVYYGAPELQILQALGCDAMAVGNHEFDLTPAALLGACAAAFPTGGFPILAANLNIDNDTVAALKTYIRPFTTKQCGSVKVGIFGLITPSTNLLSMPAPAYVSEQVLETAAAMVDTLKKESCQVVICLSHLGLSIDEAVATYVPGIDLIVGGHDHLSVKSPIPVPNPGGGTTYIVQTAGFYDEIGKVTMTVTGGAVSSVQGTLIALDGNIPADTSTAAVVGSLIAGIESIYGPLYTSRIGFATADFEEVASDLCAAGEKETPVGNLVADAFREMTGTDIAFTVGGSTSRKLFQGPLTPSDLFRAIGYGYNTANGLGFRLMTFKMTGASLMAGIEFGLSDIASNDEFLIQASGMKYEYAGWDSAGLRLRGVTMDSSTFDPAATYSVTANEFAITFLTYLRDGQQLPIDFTDVQPVGDTTEFHALCAYVQRRDTISPVYRHSVVSPVRWEGRRDGGTPHRCFLGQNFPNPFNPATTIRFELPDARDVSLVVYDLLGRVVCTLVERRMNAGSYSVRWNGGSSPSGVYFCRLRAGAYEQTTKMLLMK